MILKIAVAYHKPSLILSNDVYLPIQVGKALNPTIDLGIQPDNEGVNISDENGYYCELTATYWIWKNITADYKGLCHYRRFFTTERSGGIMQRVSNIVLKGTYIPQIVYYNENKFERDMYIMSDKLKVELGKVPIITTREVISRLSCYNYFAIIGSEYITITQNIVNAIYPDYSSVMDESLKSHRIHFANMVVMRTDYFDEYCTFVFNVLDYVKEMLVSQDWIIDLKREKIFSRKLGYIAELLTNCYIKKKKAEGVKISMCNVAYLNV